MVKVKETKEKKISMVNEVRTFYMALFKRLYGFMPIVSYPRSGAVIKRLLNNGITEHQFYLLICVHFNWRGIDGTNMHIHKMYSDKSFPIEWVSTNVNSYIAYIRNVLNINFDDETEVKKAVSDFLNEIK